MLSTGFREKTPFLVTEQLKGSVPARAQANQVFPPALTKRQKSFFTPWPWVSCQPTDLPESMHTVWQAGSSRLL